MMDELLSLDQGVAAGNLWAGPAVAVIFVLLTYRLVIHPAFFSPLAQIPNAHWSAPFSPIWILSIRFARKENRTLHAAHRRLGPIIRVGPNELSINDIDSVHAVYQGGFEKPAWYSVFDNYGYGNMLDRRCTDICSHLSKASPACSRHGQQLSILRGSD
jgi:hypothetical protein